ncbi:MAG: divalent-cation tolerance protein CutA [Mariprofundaceae bacterium]|nr:divalent-cation tolerance protein CutA [Mariprofundaceae bacterium]
MEKGACIIMTSVETEADGLRLAKGMVEKGLAACVQLSASGRSIYCWQGELQSTDEYYLNIKTTEAASEAAIAWLEHHHPYEIPEILRLSAESGRAYLQWMRATAPLLSKSSTELRAVQKTDK